MQLLLRTFIHESTHYWQNVNIDIEVSIKKNNKEYPLPNEQKYFRYIKEKNKAPMHWSKYYIEEQGNLVSDYLILKYVQDSIKPRRSLNFIAKELGSLLYEVEYLKQYQKNSVGFSGIGDDPMTKQNINSDILPRYSPYRFTKALEIMTDPLNKDGRWKLPIDEARRWAKKELEAKQYLKKEKPVKLDEAGKKRKAIDAVVDKLLKPAKGAEGNIDLTKFNSISLNDFDSLNSVAGILGGALLNKGNNLMKAKVVGTLREQLGDSAAANYVIGKVGTNMDALKTKVVDVFGLENIDPDKLGDELRNLNPKDLVDVYQASAHLEKLAA